MNLQGWLGCWLGRPYSDVALMSTGWLGSTDVIWANMCWHMVGCIGQVGRFWLVGEFQIAQSGGTTWPSGLMKKRNWGPINPGRVRPHGLTVTNQAPNYSTTLFLVINIWANFIYYATVRWFGLVGGHELAQLVVAPSHMEYDIIMAKGKSGGVSTWPYPRSIWNYPCPSAKAERSGD